MMRRRTALASLALLPGFAKAHDPFGRVEPARPAPAMALRDASGAGGDLATRLRDRVTAVQLMFTTCSATCPLQGALFAATVPLLRIPDARLLSLSIDPLNDDPKALGAWLRRFGAAPVWQAAAPRVADVDRLFQLLDGRASGPDRHTTQVYLFDRQARLVYRTPELPPPRHVAEMLETVSLAGGARVQMSRLVGVR